MAAGSHLYSTRLPFLSPCSPILPLFVYLCLSPSSGCTFSLLTTSHPPIEAKLSRQCLSLHLRKTPIFVHLLFIYISFHPENTCNRHGTLCFEPSNTASKCTCSLFVCFLLLSSSSYFIFPFPGFFASSFSPPLPFPCSLHARCFQMEGNKLKHHNKMQQERPSARAQGK